MKKMAPDFISERCLKVFLGDDSETMSRFNGKE